MEHNFKKQLLILSFIFLLIPFSSKGASIYFSPENGRYGKGDIFKIDVMLDTKGDNINTCEARISFDKNYLEVRDVSKGGSFMTLWAKEPFYSNEQGSVVLVGGIPGGFRGQGKVISIIFRALEAGSAGISFQEGSRVLLNDGKGTIAGLTKGTAAFEISSLPGDKVADEWKNEIEQDKTPPEEFEIKIGQDPTVFGGKYFISFSATDKESGVAYYQVKEGDSDWKTGQSPYLLENQDLEQKISVRAFDKAGNQRIEEFHPKRSKLFYLGLTVLLMAVLWFIRLFFKKIITKKP